MRHAICLHFQSVLNVSVNSLTFVHIGCHSVSCSIQKGQSLEDCLFQTLYVGCSTWQSFAIRDLKNHKYKKISNLARFLLHIMLQPVEFWSHVVCRFLLSAISQTGEIFVLILKLISYKCCGQLKSSNSHSHNKTKYGS